MLLQAFRLHLSRQAGDHVGLLYALADPQIGRAIEAMHGDPAHRWTLAELAGSGRAVTVGFRAAFPREGWGNADRLSGSMAHDARQG